MSETSSCPISSNLIPVHNAIYGNHTQASPAPPTGLSHLLKIGLLNIVAMSSDENGTRGLGKPFCLTSLTPINGFLSINSLLTANEKMALRIFNCFSIVAGLKPSAISSSLNFMMSFFST